MITLPVVPRPGIDSKLNAILKDTGRNLGVPHTTLRRVREATPARAG